MKNYIHQSTTIKDILGKKFGKYHTWYADEIVHNFWSNSHILAVISYRNIYGAYMGANFNETHN